jgi:hypothetical protein
MINKPFKVFIGKDTAKDADITGGETLSALMTTTGTDALGDGVIVILDKDFKVLTPGATVADSDTIYVAMGTTKTFTLSPESGTAITARKIKLSDPIKANYVRTFLGKAYTAKAEQAWTATTVTPTLAREYVVRVVYKDMYEHPGPFVQEWRYIATAADVADVDVFAAAVAAVINADPNARVVASVTAGSDYLHLTGKPIAGCTTGLNDLDHFDMVMFEPFFNYVTSTGTLAEYVDFSNTTTINYGTGTWEQMRDLELAAWGYEGVYNRREFPVIVPDFHTSTSLTYNLIVIEHEVPYKTPNNLYLETTQVKTIMAFHNGTNGDAQQAFVLTQLNPWMASTPAAFPNVAAL